MILSVVPCRNLKQLKKSLRTCRDLRDNESDVHLLVRWDDGSLGAATSSVLRRWIGDPQALEWLGICQYQPANQLAVIVDVGNLGSSVQDGEAPDVSRFPDRRAILEEGRGWLPEITLPTFTHGLEILASARKGEDGVDVMIEMSGFPTHSTRSRGDLHPQLLSILQCCFAYTAVLTVAQLQVRLRPHDDYLRTTRRSSRPQAKTTCSCSLTMAATACQLLSLNYSCQLRWYLVLLSSPFVTGESLCNVYCKGINGVLQEGGHLLLNGNFNLSVCVRVASSAGIQGREIPEKTRRPAASSGTISTCENPGIKHWFAFVGARALTATAPRPLTATGVWPEDWITLLWDAIAAFICMIHGTSHYDTTPTTVGTAQELVTQIAMIGPREYTLPPIIRRLSVEEPSELQSRVGTQARRRIQNMLQQRLQFVKYIREEATTEILQPRDYRIDQYSAIGHN
ncbi:hypothetical protein PR048_003966 [Dryococelus australis]|uniref:Uncharacterized protein n=1 Tax=Dryococelus australis TaxID=614101 RepID=A0ABQ9I466_9NEOP|nr:hypothetical protein PR048_003966 [Dryococelus australis]